MDSLWNLASEIDDFIYDFDPVAYKVPDEAVADKIMKIGIYPVGTGLQISREALNTDGTTNYAKLITYLQKMPQETS